MVEEIYFVQEDMTVNFPTSLPGTPGADGGYTSPELTTIISGSTFDIPAGKRLVGFSIDQAAGVRTFTVGLTPGGDELDSIVIPANTDAWPTVTYYTSAGATLHFTGFIGNVRVYLL